MPPDVIRTIPDSYTGGYDPGNQLISADLQERINRGEIVPGTPSANVKASDREQRAPYNFALRQLKENTE